MHETPEEIGTLGAPILQDKVRDKIKEFDNLDVKYCMIILGSGRFYIHAKNMSANELAGANVFLQATVMEMLEPQVKISAASPCRLEPPNVKLSYKDAERPILTHDWDDAADWGLAVGVTKCKRCGEVYTSTNYTDRCPGRPMRLPEELDLS